MIVRRQRSELFARCRVGTYSDASVSRGRRRRGSTLNLVALKAAGPWCYYRLREGLAGLANLDTVETGMGIGLLNSVRLETSIDATGG